MRQGVVVLFVPCAVEQGHVATAGRLAVNPLRVERAFHVHALVGVGAEIVPLRLGQVVGQPGAAIAVEVGQRDHQARRGNGRFGRPTDHGPQVLLPGQDLLGQPWIDEQVGQIGPVAVGRADLLQDRCPDDAAAAPDAGHFRQLQSVAVNLRRPAKLGHPLGVGNNHRRVKCVAELAEHGLPVAARGPRGHDQHAAGRLPLGLHHRHLPHGHRHVDPQHRHLQRQSVLRSPHAGPLLPGFIEDHVDQPLARPLVHFAEDVGRDLDQVAAQFEPVPLVIDRGQFVVAQAQALLHQVIGLGDEPHQAVFDAVVDHLDVVAGRARPEIGDARLAIDLGGDGFQHRPDPLIGFRRAAGHDARSEAGAVLAAGDAHAQVLDPLPGQLLGPAVGVLEMRVAAVDEHVARLQMRRAARGSRHRPALRRGPRA